MTGYTKLFSSIIHSTIWREANHIRLVWVTMLAMADRDGLVGASIPGLADAARVDIRQCEEAISKLMSPDKYSRSKNFDGRRIIEVDGGWEILNYHKYREMASKDEQRSKAAERQRKKRERDASRNVTQCHAQSRTVTQSNDIAEAEADTKEEDIPPLSPQWPGGKTKKRATQIPDGWFPKDSHRTKAVHLGFDVDSEAESFTLHAISTGRTLKNWDAGFSMWLKKAAEFAHKGGGGRQVPVNPKTGIPLVSWGAKNHAANMAALDEDRRQHEAHQRRNKQNSEKNQPCIPGVIHDNTKDSGW